MEKYDISYYMNLNYEIKVKKVNDKWKVFIPDLNIVASGKDIQTAFECTEELKKKYFQNIIDNDLFEFINFPNIPIQNKINYGFSEIYTFIIKFFISMIIIIFIFITASILVVKEIKKTSSNFKNSVSNVMLSIEEMPDEKINKYKIRINKIVKKIKPLTDELHPLFRDNQIYKESF